MGVIEVVAVLGGIVALYFLNQSKAAGSLVFYPDNITGLSFEGASPVVQASILVQNPSNTSFTFQSFAASATSDGVLVGNVSNFTPVSIGANSEGLMPIKIRLLLLSAANDVIDAIQNRNVKKKLELKGTINTNGVPVPITLNYEIGL